MRTSLFICLAVGLLTCASVDRVVAQATDADENGFPDAIEQQLINDYCPSLVLHPGDQGVSPEPVEIVTGQLWGSLRSQATSQYNGEYLYADFDNTKKYADWDVDDEVGLVDAPTEGCGVAYGPHRVFVHFDYGGRGEWCQIQSRDVNDQPTEPAGNDWYRTYHQGADWTSNAGHVYRTRPGSYYPNTVYAHPFHYTDSSTGQVVYVIQYWFFYPFNDWVSNHEGDWEHINVFLSANQIGAQVTRVVYYFHHSYTVAEFTQTEDPSVFDCYMVDGTHPVVFVGGYFTACKSYGPGLEDCGSGNGSHGSYPMRGLWTNVDLESGYADRLDPGGLYIPWWEIVDGDETDRDGVVLIKERDSYDYSDPVYAHLSWLKADILWGRTRVWSMGSGYVTILEWLGHDEIGNLAPRGPAHQATWNAPYGIGSFVPHAGEKPYARAYLSGWTPPLPLALTGPDEGATVFDIVDIEGTVNYADSISIRVGLGGSPTDWTRKGTTVAFSGPVFEKVIGKWNTGTVPAGVYTVQVTAHYGTQVQEVTRTVNVTHRSATVGTVGGNFSDIQLAINWAQMGDTIRVYGSFFEGSVTMKETVQLLAPVPGVILDGSDDSPTITIENHTYPCLIDGFTISHDGWPSFPGSATEHGARIHNASPVFRNCVFQNNVATNGGAVLITNSGTVPLALAQPVFENCAFLGNRANISGGAVLVQKDYECSYKCPNGPGVKCYDCVFVGNVAGQAGGGAAVSLVGAGAYRVWFKGCVFSEHDLYGEYDGTTILLSDVAELSFEDCTFADNGTEDVVRCVQTGYDTYSPLFKRCTFARNTGEGGVIGWVAGQWAIQVQGSIMAFNGGPFSVGGTDLAYRIDLRESILFANNDRGTGPADAFWTTVGISNRSEDPAFCDATGGDYTSTRSRLPPLESTLQNAQAPLTLVASPALQ